VAAVDALSEFPERFSELAQVARNNLDEHATKDLRFLLAYVDQVEDWLEGPEQVAA
jgi:hypothetical protein